MPVVSWVAFVWAWWETRICLARVKVLWKAYRKPGELIIKPTRLQYHKIDALWEIRYVTYYSQ